ncbi:MAG: DUF2336 domain-containing protein [Hyphomonadaceae bacterium]|nr:DUF2336 domain-containing protein [Hyphomonadaceae bacterium]
MAAQGAIENHRPDLKNSAGLAMTTSRFGKLVELARVTDSERRRELLREVTDLFFETTGARTQTADELFSDILRTVCADMQDGVLTELAERFADAPDAPVALMADLANHSFEVAAPVLTRSSVLGDDLLLEVVHTKSQEHIKAIAQRPTVSEKLSDAVVAKGDDRALDALIRNEGATISRTAFEVVTERARANVALHEGMVTRSDLPLDLLNDMYFVVAAGLRDQILTRNASVDPAALDAALAKTRARLTRSSAAQTDDARRAERFIQLKKAAGELNGILLVSLFRARQILQFQYGLAELTNLDVETVRQLIDRKDIDALAMICRAAGIERALFVTLAIVVIGGEDAVKRGEEFGKLYQAVPIEAAQRAMRFYKVRKASEKEAA